MINFDMTLFTVLTTMYVIDHNAIGCHKYVSIQLHF